MNKTSSWPTWLNEFADALRNNEKRAENNVLDLPTVNWQDETFYVKFNEHGATLYNKFATVVKEIDGVKDMESVDNFLNENSVVAAKEDVEEEVQVQDTDVEQEIQTTDDVVEEAMNDDTDTSTLEEIAEEETPVTVEDDSLTKELEDIMSAPETQEVENTTDIEALQKEVAELRSIVNELLDKITQPELVPEISDESEEVIASYEKSIEEECEGEECENTLEKRVASLETKLAEMIHAYETIENDRYDLKSEEQEMKHVQENKEISEKILQKEHELDLSKQEDRGKLNADFLSEVLSEFNIEMNPVNEAVQEAIENEEPIEEKEIEENPIDGNVQMVDPVAPVEAANEEIAEETEENNEEVLEESEEQNEEISDEQLLEIYNNLTPEQVVKVKVETENDEPADVYFPVTGLEEDTDEDVINLLKERGVLDAEYFVLLNGNVEEVYPATKEQFIDFLKKSNLLEVAKEETEEAEEETAELPAEENISGEE